MPFKYDPEFTKALEPLLPILASRAAAETYDWEARRTGIAALITLLKSSAPPSPDVETTVDHVTVKDGTKIPIYISQRKDRDPAAAPGPAVVHFHGGGMIAGQAEQFAIMNESWVQDSSVPFFSVEYRLAPENNGTGLVDDSYAGLLWVRENASRFNIDPARIAVMGESAGGGISAGVALKARDEGLSPPLAKQILVYPMLDDRNNKANEELEPLAFWKMGDNLTGWAALLGRDKAGVPDADVSYYSAPARAPSVRGLPPTYIDVGTLDYFRDEDILYASRLALENIEVDLHVYPNVPHAFEGLAPNMYITRKSRENRLRALATF